MDSKAQDLQPLMQEDNSDCEEYFDHALDDSSSGYDSTDIDVSDVDSDDSMMSQNISYLSKHKPTYHDAEQQVRAHVSSTKTLYESLKLILDMPEMCDVTFLVGTDNTPVNGVRSILATRSKVMYQLIFNHIKTLEGRSSFGVRLAIPVHKYDAEVFRMLIQFIHCGTATITDQTVTGLICGACQFELQNLEAACWRYLRARLCSGQEETILAGSRKYKEHRNYAFIMELIYKFLDERFNDRKGSRGTNAPQNRGLKNELSSRATKARETEV
ncbi:GPRS-like protein [Mya arenaria]|uniref:GPRS-like protein n=1 Tax=Mya arenaria TaxID=6604 RepID=A0ABY7DEF9_MYAAR|nr:serine-enriched protein-like [Mya arenaria]WAQ94468.1 GPRS-like protein [Mya arenaria]